MVQQSIRGDSFATDLPVTQLDEQVLTNERKMAKFSKSEEYKRLKAHLEERIKFYESFLPDGRDITSSANMVEAGQNWVVANSIIGEFKAVLQAYEQAKDAVSDATRP